MNSMTTDNADLITYHAKRTGQIPPMYIDTLTGRVVADVSTESHDAFIADAALQRFLSVKVAVWRGINGLRQRGTR